MHQKSHDLFSNFQSTVFKAAKLFLSKKKEEKSDKLMTTTLRIPNEVKVFYECLAEADMTSINTAIVNTLGKIKDQTVSEYQKRYSKINEIFDYQINSFLKIIDSQNIDYNDLCPLLEWATDTKVSRIDITNKEKLIGLLDKTTQLKLCKIFGYSYEWIQNNSRSISYKRDGFENRWYKNVENFCKALINNFFLDESVKSFNLSFLCCDRDVIDNIISGVTPDTEESITPIAVADRCINGVSTRTYHLFESNNINYRKCRQHFIVLAKMIAMLTKHGVIGHSKGYVITPQQHDQISDGSMHPAELLHNNLSLTYGFYIEDLEAVETRSFASASASEAKTNSPKIYHALNASILNKIIIQAEKQDLKTIYLTDDLSSKFNMNSNMLVKYLRLFELEMDLLSTHQRLVLSGSDGYYTELNALRKVSTQIDQIKVLDTCFG